MQREVVSTFGDFEVASHVQLLEVIDFQVEVAQGIADDFIADLSVENDPSLGALVDVNSQVQPRVGECAAGSCNGIGLCLGLFEPHKFSVIHIVLAVHGQGEIRPGSRFKGGINLQQGSVTRDIDVTGPACRSVEQGIIGDGDVHECDGPVTDLDTEVQIPLFECSVQNRSIESRFGAVRIEKGPLVHEESVRYDLDRPFHVVPRAEVGHGQGDAIGHHLSV